MTSISRNETEKQCRTGLRSSTQGTLLTWNKLVECTQQGGEVGGPDLEGEKTEGKKEGVKAARLRDWSAVWN